MLALNTVDSYFNLISGESPEVWEIFAAAQFDYLTCPLTRVIFCRRRILDYISLFRIKSNYHSTVQYSPTTSPKIEKKSEWKFPYVATCDSQV